MSQKNSKLQEYYVEALDNLPFGKTVELFEQQLPGWFAFSLAAWFRMRARLGIPKKPQYGIRWTRQLETQRREDMPARALSRWARHIEGLQDLGFVPCGWMNSETIGAKQESLALFLDQPGTTMAQLLWIRMNGADGVVEQTPLSLTSCFANDRELLTGSIAQEHIILTDTLTPDYIDADFHPDTISVQQLFALHSDKPAIRTALRFSPAQALIQYEQQRIRFFEYECNAGAIRPLSPREVAYVRTCSLPP